MLHIDAAAADGVRERNKCENEAKKKEEKNIYRWRKRRL